MADAQLIGGQSGFPSRPLSVPSKHKRAWLGGLQRSEFVWAVAFIIPYAAVFLAFVAYPVVYGLWLGHDPALYAELLSEPIYQRTVVNTVLYVVIGVNLKMFGALLLSGLFMRRGWWVKGLLLIFVLPWAMPALPAFISIHWMLNSQWGLLNNFLWNVFGVDGPGWLDTSRWLALGAVIVSHIWKWMPFWTVILLAGRMAIPQELYEAAEMDGATGLKRFVHVTFPRCWPTSISSAHCSRRSLRSVTSTPSISCPAAGPLCRRMCWRRWAYAMPSRSRGLISAWRR